MRRNKHSAKYCELSRGRTCSKWTGVAGHGETGETPRQAARRLGNLDINGTPQPPPRGAIDVSVGGMHIRIRSRAFGDRSQRRMYTISMPVREMTSRLPTIALIDELAARAEDPGVAALLDAMQVNGHPLGQPLADLLAKFTDEVAALRRASAANKTETSQDVGTAPRKG